MIFAATALPSVFADSLEPVAVVVSLALFAVSLGIWVWAFAVAVVRSSQGDDIVVGNLFLFEGDAPKAVRRQLFASVGVCLVITVVSASANPFGVLVPMLPLGFVGLWGARHGGFRPRPGTEPEIRPLRPERSARKRRSPSGGAGK